MYNRPKFLYFLQEDLDYVSSYTGNPDINKMLTSSAYWKKTVLKEKPKTLILSDWTARNWSYGKTEKVKDLMGQLLEEGFTIYIWQEGKLVPLTAESLSLIDDPKIKAKIRLATPEEIIAKSAEDIRIPKEEMQILDDYYLDSLLDDKLPISRPYQISISSLTLESEEKIQSIVYPKNPDFIHDEYSEASNKLAAKLVGEGKNVTTSFQKIVIAADKIKDVIDKQSSEFKEVKTFVTTELDENNYFYLTPSEFAKIFENFPQLETCRLSSVDFTINRGDPEEAKFIAPHLKRLELKYVSQTVKAFDSMLKQFENLQVLKLESCSLDPVQEFSPSGILVNLEELYLCNFYEDENVPYLSAILNDTKKLKTLVIDCDIRAISAGIKMTELETLEFRERTVLDAKNFTTINPQFLKHLNEIAPNVKKITFHPKFKGFAPLFFSFTASKPVYVESVTEIDLSKSNIINSSAGIQQEILNFKNSFPNMTRLIINEAQFELIKSLPLYQENRQLFVVDSTSPMSIEGVVDKSEEKKSDEKKSDDAPIERKDPIFSPSTFRDWKPHDEEPVFTGKNKTRNQGMIIEKLSRYLNLTSQESEKKLIQLEKLGDGICVPLTQIFLQNKDEWQHIEESILNWSGSQEDLNKNQTTLEKSFNTIIEYIKKYHFKQGEVFKRYYIGDDISLLLKERKPHSICNPWHAIGIIPAEALPTETEPAWIVYDPNFIEGPKRVLESKMHEVLTTQLGSNITKTVLIEEKDPNYPFQINSTPKFIENGGLFTLCDACNNDEILKIVLEHKEPFPQSALNGLLLRNTQGEPAWIFGLNHPKMTNLTRSLLQQFNQSFEDAIPQLQKSLENLSPMRQHALIELLLPKSTESKSTESKVTIEKTKTTNFKELIEALHSNPKTDYYEKKLETWRKRVAEPVSSDRYLQQTLATEEKNVLVQITSNDNLRGFQYDIQKYCIKTGKPYFYIHSPSDLVCTDRWILQDGKNQGEIQSPPGGLLYDFLKKHEKDSPILIVNYENFTASDIVRFNALLDKVPNTDGVNLPEKTKVIGFINPNNPNSYQGSDFYSRFGIKEFCISTFPPPNLPFVEDKKPTFKIELYGAEDWEAKLLGSWHMQGDNLFFKEGLLKQAFDEKHTHIGMSNGVWANPKFKYMMEQASQLGYIDYAGRRIQVPKDFKIIKSQGYDWSERKKLVTFQAGNVIKNIPVLNPLTFNDFFTHYKVDNNIILSDRGIIQENKGKTLELNVTRNMTEGQWARLVDECKRYNVTLVAHCSPEITLPAALSIQGVYDTPEFKLPHHTQVIASTDLDFTTAQFGMDQEEWEIIDVTHLNPSDLLIHVDVVWDNEHKRFNFTEKPHALIEGLKNGKNILLKGNFSNDLIDALNPFILKRLQEEKPLGKLTILAERNPFSYLNPKVEKVTTKEKMDFLNMSYVENQLSFTHLRAFKQHDTKDPWIGMRQLPSFSKTDSKVNLSDSKKISENFTQQRINSVNHILQNSPFVFLSGLSGIGKSTFVQKELLSELKNETTPGKLFQSENQIKAWAEEKNPGRKILFIDEANIGKRSWNEFEGLFHTPPNILIDGKVYRLTNEHQVIFAGNPVSYGDERQLAPFFSRHGNALLFEPLPPEYIYEYILKPIFKNSPAEIYQEKVSEILLTMYQFFQKHSRDQVLISPRELQMMALLVVSHSEVLTNETEAITLAEYFAYKIGADLSPDGIRAEFVKLFEPKQNLLPAEDSTDEKGFLVTHSRQSIVNHLDHLLHLRNFRTENKYLNEDQLYGGLGGLILEGNPAAGKSDLVISHLRYLGFQEKHFNSLVADKEINIFYRMPVSMNLQEKEAFLLKAFNEGAIVIIDEINSSPMMERLLNTLTMGKTPEGVRPKRPGFTIIGTQNPITMAGRRAASTALSRRLTTLPVPNYTRNELEEILVNRGVNLSQAKQMAESFEKQYNYAIQNRLNPPPTLRDLLKLADESIELMKNANLLISKPAVTKNPLSLELTATELDFNILNDIESYNSNTKAFAILQLIMKYIEMIWTEPYPEPIAKYHELIKDAKSQAENYEDILIEVIDQSKILNNNSGIISIFSQDKPTDDLSKILMKDLSSENYNELFQEILNEYHKKRSRLDFRK